MKIASLSLAASPLILVAYAALAQQPAADMADLVGAKGAGGETQLQARGFDHVKTETSGDSKYSYWWNNRTNRCLTVRTADGRYASIVDTSPIDCGMTGGGFGHGGGAQGGGNYGGGMSSSDAPPEVMVGGNGEGEVIFKGNNCVVYYNSAGIRTRSLPSCTTSQKARAAAAMASYRREQGMAGPVANHSPVYRDFSSNRINLICHGDGTRLTYSNNMGYRWDEDRQRYLPQSIPGYEREQYDAYLTIQLDGNRGRIRLPKSMVPAIHSDDNHGWRELKDLRYTRSSIKGSYKLNALNKPNITINRRTGRINISGQRGFNGNCVALDRGSLRWR